MSTFKYKNIIDEFKLYLDENLEDSIYFESLRIKFYRDDEKELAYRDIIKKNKFSTPRVLNNKGTSFFTEQIRTLRKVKKYEDYSYTLFEDLGKNSVLENRINSIQAICTNSHLQKKHFFFDIDKESDDLPISVKVSFKNFDLLFNNDPFESLSELLVLINEEEKNENLYFNFVRYYLSNNNIKSLLTESINTNRKNENAYIIAILYIFFIKGDKFNELSGEFKLIDKVIKKLSKALPLELNQRFNIIESITSKLVITL